jgi:uncharacterized DUF497 family protein
MWEGDHVIIPAKNISGEKRFALLGKVQQKCYVAIFTKRRERIRIISCHHADEKWRKIYEKKITEQ